ncbi:hypothetical protein Lnau_2934 [Legionella nautarum]|uniref:Uncharacterized protein n=1 Tax=Legionella nautarum TaxID=45070 RepID=A0A0W0WMG9_9GAMM|nr:hypothetical protein Lnau_2934 [Legionella nautarum]
MLGQGCYPGSFSKHLGSTLQQRHLSLIVQDSQTLCRHLLDWYPLTLLSCHF